jgi:hypothetical protein
VKVKDLLGHRHVTTTQIYDKRRRSTWRHLTKRNLKYAKAVVDWQWFPSRCQKFTSPLTRLSTGSKSWSLVSGALALRSGSDEIHSA